MTFYVTDHVPNAPAPSRRRTNAVDTETTITETSDPELDVLMNIIFVLQT